MRGTLFRVEDAHLPKPTARAKKTLWLWATSPQPLDLHTCWRAYLRRFDIEHTPCRSTAALRRRGHGGNAERLRADSWVTPATEWPRWDRPNGAAVPPDAVDHTPHAVVICGRHRLSLPRNKPSPSVGAAPTGCGSGTSRRTCACCARLAGSSAARTACWCTTHRTNRGRLPASVGPGDPAAEVPE